MEQKLDFIETLKQYGIGQRKINDNLFAKDKPPHKLCIYDVDDENLCHDVVKCNCSIPGCLFTSESLIEFEQHYNISHRYSCSQCKKVLPSPHLLDLHIQEMHDSFFAVVSLKKPSYSCYIEHCKEMFMTAEERLDHCTNVHKLPKDFRFDTSRKKQCKKGKNKTNANMDVDTASEVETKKIHKKPFSFTNNKQKAFHSFTRKKGKNDGTQNNVNFDEIMTDLKDSLPI